MTDPSLALQGAVYQALTAGNVTNVLAVVPPGTALPWTVIGDDQVMAAYESAEMYECFANVHIFGKMPEHKQQSALVMAALNSPIDIQGFGIVEYGFEDSRTIREKDDKVGHLVMTFRYLVQPL